jgi:5-methylcytosine-specific restriction endonuclease McrA
MRYLPDKKRILGQCTWCEKPVKKPKKYWCGPDCVHEWKLRRDGSYLREHVFKRDSGVCSRCGKDCHTDWLKLKRLRTQYLQTHFGGSPSKYLLDQYWELATSHGVKLPANPAAHLVKHRPRSLWEADHKLAVEEGGGACGLDNITTLCIECHRAKTAKHTKRRARKAKRAKKK